MTAPFGTPSPLPGQPGFRSSPSEVMARETAEMAKRLARLKNELAIEASLRDDDMEKTGGVRWRSARDDRGSVRAYAKDVKHRYQQQICKRSQGVLVGHRASRHGKPQAGTGAKAAAALREEQQMLRQQLKGDNSITDVDSGMRNGHIIGGFANKHVGRWSLWDTVDWLNGLGLGQYSNVFRANEISGTILLEVGADDLDYMNVRILAHRKLILKGIEELRRLSRDGINIPPPAPWEQSSAEESIVQASCTDREQTQAPFAERDQDDARQSKQKHTRDARCHLGSPPKSHAVAVDCGPISPANLTKDECNHGMSHVGSAAHISPNRECETVTHQPPHGISSTLGLDTCSSQNTQVIPINRLPSYKQKARGIGRTQSPMLGVKGSSECWTNPFDKSPSDTSVTPDLWKDENATTGCFRSDGVEFPTQNGFPTLDEEAEHEAFRRAVADWNRGRGGSSSRRKRNSDASQGRSVDGDEPSDRSTRVQMLREPEGSVPASARRRATELQVEALREQMDSDHRKQSKLLEQTRKTLLQGLQTRSTDCGEIFIVANQSNISEGTGCSEHDFKVGPEDNDLLEREAGESDETSSIASRSDNADLGGGTSAVEIEIVKSVFGTRECTDGESSSYVVEGDTSSEEG